MASTYSELTHQIAQLTAQAELARKREVAGVISRIKEAIAVYGITASDLGLDGTAAGGKPVAKAPAHNRQTAAAASSGVVKYRDDAGNTWSGRGPKPGWFKAALAAGHTPEDLAA